MGGSEQSRGTGTIPGRFLDCVGGDPGRVAVRGPFRAWTYGEVERRSGRIAAALRQRGIGSGDRVGVSVGRHPDVVPAVLGVLRAGAAYVPVDPAYPPARIALMCEDAGVEVTLVSDGAIEGVLGLPVAELVQGDGGPQEADPEWLPSPQDLAYIVYTSGSTGRPKGVCIPHSAVDNLITAMARRPGIGRDDTLLAVVSLSFDLSVFDLFAPLSVGGSVVIAEGAVVVDGHRLARWMDRFEVSYLQGTPATFRLLLEAGWRAQRPVTFLNGGEALPQDLVAPVLQAGCSLWNGYGPAEATVCSAVAAVVDPAAPVTIGTPLHGVTVHLLDDELREVAEGDEGELFLGGVQVGLGYYQQPDKTAERFIEVPGRGRLYRSGDLARWVDGQLDFRGRIDFQLKIRGHRIEPGEVEARLNQHPAVYASAVGGRPGPGGELALVAWLQLRQDVGTAELRGWLAQVLPAYLLPTAWVVLPTLPLSPSGKIDRIHLPDPVAAAGEYVAPHGPQIPVAEAFAAVLGVRRVGIHDDFFELGGHSLAAGRLAARLRRELGIELPVTAVFQASTVAALTAQMHGLARPLPALEKAPPGKRPASSPQRRLWFVARTDEDLAYRLALTVDLRGALGAPAVQAALDALVARQEALRTALVERDGELVQVVAEQRVALLRLDLEGLPEAEAAEQIAVQRSALLRPFDLERGAVLRAALLRRCAEHHTLLLAVHHAAFDGASVAPLQRDLAALLGSAELPELPLQVGDHALWERAVGQEPRAAEDLAWWAERLRGAPRLALPTDRGRPAVRRPEAVVVDFELPGIGTDLARLAGSGATPFMALLAAFSVWMAARTGQRDLPIATPVAGRSHEELDGLIGFLANTLVLRVAVGGTFEQLVQRTRATVLDAFGRQHVPLDRVVSAVAPGQVDQPLAQVCFVAQDAPPAPLTVGGVTVTVRESAPAGAPFDLTVQVWEEDGIRGSFIGRADLFDAATLGKLAADWARAAGELLASTGPVDPWIDGVHFEQERLVRGVEGVGDCVVGARPRPDGATDVVAWVVPDGRAAWGTVARSLHEHVDVAVPVAALPLRDGRVDRAPLAPLQPIDGPVADHHVQLAALDRAWLLPSWSTLASGRSEGSSEEDDAPSLEVGPPLDFPPGAPVTLPGVLRAAHGTLHTLELDGSEATTTYAELLDRAERASAGLRELGFRPGDPLILQLRRNLDFVVGLWTGLLSGAVVVPLAAAPAYDGDVGKLRSAWDLLDAPWILGDRETAPELRRWAERQALEGLQVVDLGGLDAPAEPLPDPDPEALCLLLLTSGSTGLPKAVRHCHRTALSQAEGYCAHHGFGPGDVFLNWLPLDHVGGLFMNHVPALWRSASQVHAPTPHFLERPLRWLEWVQRFGATYTWAPNFAFGLVADAVQEHGGSWDLSTLRCAMNGGEAVVASTARRFLSLLAPSGLPGTAMVPAWGMSELASCSTSALDFALETTSDGDPFVCVGHPQPGFAVRIVQDGRVVGRGRRGTLQCRGPSVTDGYHRRPDLTEAVFEDGWFDTGDLAFLDERGLWITGRSKDEIIIHGINHAAHELEACAETVAGVQRSFVAALAVRPPGSDTDKLALVLAVDGDEEAALRGVRKAIARAHGVAVDFLAVVEPARIPKTDIGKIQRSRLKADFEGGAFDDEVRRTGALLGDGEQLPAWFWARELVERAPTPVEGPGGAATHGGAGLVVAIGDGELLKGLAQDPEGPVVLGLSWSSPPGPDAPSIAEQAAIAGLGVIQRAAQRGQRLVVVTRGAPGEPPDPRAAALLGLLPAATVELPELRARHVEVDDPSVLSVELAGFDGEASVVWRGGRRFVVRLRPALDAPGPEVVAAGPVLVAGGGGGVGGLLVRHLRRLGHAVLSLGRSSGDVAVDIADPAAVRRAVAVFEAEHGALGMVFQLAAVLADRTLLDEDAGGIAAVAAARIHGTATLAALAEERGALFVDLGTVHGFLGGFGLGAYGAGSRFGAALCAGLRARGQRAWHIASSTWGGVGLSAGRPGDRAETLGYRQLDPSTGLPSLFAALRSPDPVVLLGLDGGNPWMRSRMLGAELLRFEARAPVAKGAPAAPEAAGSGATEQAVAAIWRDLLAVDSVGLDDNFFDLGGHSMLIARLQRRVVAEFDRDVPIVEFFRNPTVRSQARFLDGGAGDDATSSARDRARRRRDALRSRRKR